MVCISYKNPLFFYLPIIISVLLLLSSCGSEVEKDNNEVVEKGEYFIVIDGDSGKTILDAKLSPDTNWDQNMGYIYLGTEEDSNYNGAIGTMHIQIAYEDVTDEDVYYPTSVILSKTDQRIGTAAELNARLYNYTSGGLFEVEIGANFIRGKIDLVMERERIYPQDEAETVTVQGTFTAVNK